MFSKRENYNLKSVPPSAGDGGGRWTGDSRLQQLGFLKLTPRNLQFLNDNFIILYPQFAISLTEQN